MEPMKEEMNEMRVRTEQMQNHAMEQMQEAKDIKMKKFLDEAMIKKTVGSVFTVVAFVGVPLGNKFGLFEAGTTCGASSQQIRPKIISTARTLGIC